MPLNGESERGKRARLNRIRVQTEALRRKVAARTRFSQPTSETPLPDLGVRDFRSLIGSGFLKPDEIWNPDPREIKHECCDLCAGTVHCDLVSLESNHWTLAEAEEEVRNSYSAVFGQVVDRVLAAVDVPNWRDIFDMDEQDIVRPSSSGRWGSHWIVYWTMTIEAKGIVIITPQPKGLTDGEDKP